MKTTCFLYTLIIYLSSFTPIHAAPNAKLLEQRGIGAAWAVRYTPDDNILVGGVNISLIDGQTGEVIRQYLGHDSLVFVVIPSPDGKTFLSFSEDYDACLWDLETGQLINRFSPQGDNLGSQTVGLNYTPDGSGVILGLYKDTLLQVYDIETDTITDKYNIPPDVYLCEMTSDGTKLLMSFRNKGTRLLDFDTGDIIFETPDVYATNISPDETYFFAFDRCEMHFYSMETGEFINSVSIDEQNTGYISYAAFTPDGNSLLVHQYSSGIMTLKLIDASSYELITEIGQYNFDFGFHHSFSSDGSTILISNGTKLDFWEMETSTMERSLDCLRMFGFPSAFSPDKSKLVSFWDVDYNFRLYDSQTLEVLHTFDVQSPGDGQAVSFSPDGSKVVTAQAVDNTAYIWSTQTGEKLHELNHNNHVYRTHFSPGGETILMAGNDLQLWDANTGVMIKEVGEDISFNNTECFSPDSSSVYIADKTSIHVWNIEENQPVDTIETDLMQVDNIQVSPDGQFMTILGWKDYNTLILQMIETESKNTIFRRVYSNDDSNNSYSFSLNEKVIFSPDMSQLLLYGDNGYLIHSQSGRDLLELPLYGLMNGGDDFSTSIRAAKFSSDGTKLFTINEYGVIQVWDTSKQAEESGICLY